MINYQNKINIKNYYSINNHQGKNLNNYLNHQPRKYLIKDLKIWKKWIRE